ncbi:TAM domain methyltransferase [Thermoascus aurantiacus ATCC 26904]
MAEQTTSAVQPGAVEVDQLSAYSASLTSSVLDYKYTHGRRYHAYHAGSYQFPNDEQEQERLDLLHHVYVHLACEGKLHFPPFKPDGARILDMGTGTGMWAIEMGDLYPSAELILGNDLSPIQPSWVPQNVKFLVDDVESEWAYDRPFDYIHERHFAASIKDWPRLIQQCYQNLKPGGWVEFQEPESPCHSEDGTGGPDHYVVKMLDLLDQAIGERYLNPAPHFEGWLRDAGKEIGAFMAGQYLDGVDAFTNAPFTQVLKWSKLEVEVFNAKVRQDVLNRKYHAIHNFHIVYAQKPEHWGYLDEDG